MNVRCACGKTVPRELATLGVDDVWYCQSCCIQMWQDEIEMRLLDIAVQEAIEWAEAMLRGPLPGNG